MKATLTELRRDTGRVLGAVIHGHQAVEITQHGETVADIQPCTKPLRGAEFARRWKNRKPLDKGNGARNRRRDQVSGFRQVKFLLKERRFRLAMVCMQPLRTSMDWKC